jgi:hypothetical protein
MTFAATCYNVRKALEKGDVEFLNVDRYGALLKARVCFAGSKP